MKKNKLLVFLLAAVSTTAIAAAGCAPEAGGHSHSYSWKSNAENHWEECSCGNKKAEKSHVDAVNNETGVDGADGKCDDCGRLNYAVTFKMNGHGTEPATQYVYEGGNAVDPGVIPEDGIDGYTFGGWYEDEDCTIEFDFVNKEINTATNVYAKWLVSVTFDTHGHGTEPDAQSVKLGGTVTPPTDEPEYGADGYLFGGWTLDDSGAEDATPYDFSTPVDGPLTLYAIWVADVRPLVTFNLGSAGDNEVYSLLRVEEGGYATKPAVDPDIDGYLFDGWYTEDGDEPFDFANTPIDGDITLYAHWSVDERTMFAFDLQGHGDSIPTQKLRLEEGEKPVRPADPTADGYHFAGWYANPECDGDEYDFDAELTGDTTVYAKWTVTVTFDVQGHGTAPDDKEVKDGGLVPNPGNLADEPEYKFGGWFHDANCTDEFDFDSDTVDAATTIYAKWTYVIPSLVLGDDATSVIGDRTELQFQYTATEDGRYKLELASGASERCYFTTDLAEDDGVYYGEDYELFAKTFDLYRGETVIVTLHRGANINDTLRLGFYFSKVTDEALPADGWISGKYTNGTSHTIEFNRDTKEVTYGGTGYTASYIGGSFNYLYFTSTASGGTVTNYTLKETAEKTLLFTIKVGNANPTTATLTYVEPQRPITVDEFAGTYEVVGRGVDSPDGKIVNKLVIYESGSGYIETNLGEKFTYTLNENGSAYNSHENILKWGNYEITANLGEDDTIESLTVENTNGANAKDKESVAIANYNRTGDAPVEVPDYLPVDAYVDYVGQHFTYYNGGYYRNVSHDLDYVNTFKPTDYKDGKYVVNCDGTNYNVAILGSEGNYTIEIYRGNTLYDTLKPLVLHDLPVDEAATVLTSDFLLGSRFYYYKVNVSGNYVLNFSDGSVRLLTNVETGNLAGLDYAEYSWNEDKVKLSEGQVVALDILMVGQRPESFTIKFEKQEAGEGQSEDNPKELEFDLESAGWSWTFTDTDGDTYYAEFTPFSEGDYNFSFYYLDGNPVYMTLFYLDGVAYGWDSSEFSWKGGLSFDKANVTLHLSAGQTVKIRLIGQGWGYSHTIEVKMA